MKFEMMAIDRNRQLESCKRFLIMDLESIEKMQGMGCSDECIKEALNICFNHAGNLYVCGMIDEEFFRVILDGIVENDAMEGLAVVANDLRKDIVKCTG